MVARVQSEPKFVNLPDINTKNNFNKLNAINDDKSMQITQKGKFQSKISMLTSNQAKDNHNDDEEVKVDDDLTPTKVIMGAGK